MLWPDFCNFLQCVVPGTYIVTVSSQVPCCTLLCRHCIYSYFKIFFLRQSDTHLLESCRPSAEPDVCVVVFSLLNRSSFQYAKQKVQDLKRNHNGKIGILLLGNKSDVIQNRRVSNKGQLCPTPPIHMPRTYIIVIFMYHLLSILSIENGD